MNTKSNALRTYLEANGSTPSRELIAHFKISRPTLARWISALGDDVITIGRTSSTAYAARDSQAATLPLYTITETGKAQRLGTLIPLVRCEWILRSETHTPSLFHREFKDGLYPGWPWFLADLRPSGFLGRAFARRMSRLLDFDDNPENWSDQEVARALSKFGSNLQGHFIVGESAIEAYLNHAPEIIKEHPETEYAQLAERALEDGSEFGSSAGGEQQKFTTCTERNGETRHVIVKFSPPLSESAGRRWADLLIAEHIANQILTANGLATAHTHIRETGERIFLESERFDRIGAKGRRGLVTLRALDATFIGQGSGSWIQCARKLCDAKLISSEDYIQITRLWLFGELIANTDMHFGNLSFFLEDSFPLKLAPCYDMLPMRFRPAPSGEITKAQFQPKHPLPEYEATWLEMKPLALDYWQTLSKDPRISEPFQVIANECYQRMAMGEAFFTRPTIKDPPSRKAFSHRPNVDR